MAIFANSLKVVCWCIFVQWPSSKRRGSTGFPLSWKASSQSKFLFSLKAKDFSWHRKGAFSGLVILPSLHVYIKYLARSLQKLTINPRVESVNLMTSSLLVSLFLLWMFLTCSQIWMVLRHFSLFHSSKINVKMFLFHLSRRYTIWSLWC